MLEPVCGQAANHVIRSRRSRILVARRMLCLRLPGKRMTQREDAQETDIAGSRVSEQPVQTTNLKE